MENSLWSREANQRDIIDLTEEPPGGTSSPSAPTTATSCERHDSKFSTEKFQELVHETVIDLSEDVVTTPDEELHQVTDVLGMEEREQGVFEALRAFLQRNSLLVGTPDSIKCDSYDERYSKLWKDYKKWRFESLGIESESGVDLTEKEFHEFYQEEFLEKHRKEDDGDLSSSDRSKECCHRKRTSSERNSIQAHSKLNHLREFEARKEADYKLRVTEQSARLKRLLDSEDGHFLLNPGHGPEATELFIPEEVRDLLKPHQIEGIQFLWKNLITLSRTGCILAHSMGLGKTFQIVTFLLSYFRYGLVGTKALIVCPTTVVQNWSIEFRKWLKPETLRELKSIQVMDRSHKTWFDRTQLLNSWMKDGGVLIMGYSMYRRLLLRILKVLPSSLLEKDSVYQALMNPGPSIVICDEGHIIKNPKSALSKLLKSMHTQRRICLTGYPLQNNLIEYWCMVDFVYPGFLGDVNLFRRDFIIPIDNGLSSDSTRAEVAVAKRKLYVLSHMLDDFVQRRDASILEKALPSKTEFVISCRLSELQKNIYETFLSRCQRFFSSDNNVLVGSMIANLICNHPIIFKRTLEAYMIRHQSRRDESSSVSRKHASSDKGVNGTLEELESHGHDSIEDILESASLNPAMEYDSLTLFHMTWIDSFLDVLDQPGDPVLSFKMLILLHIVNYCRCIGDKVVIFSQSLHTLDYIETLFKAINDEKGDIIISYVRLDGRVSMTSRQPIIDRFNDPKLKLHVFLSSTRAGSLGINLVGANRVILLDVCWNPIHDEQAVVRVFRYGQTKPVYIYRLQAFGTFEDKMYQNNIRKGILSKRVLDKLPLARQFSRNDMSRYFILTQPPPPPTAPVASGISLQTRDVIMLKILEDFPAEIVRVHHHDSLFHHDETESLSIEEKREAEIELHYQMNKLRMNLSTMNTSFPSSLNSYLPRFLFQPSPVIHVPDEVPSSRSSHNSTTTTIASKSPFEKSSSTEIPVSSSTIQRPPPPLQSKSSSTTVYIID